ncbi:E3 ubiquitin-protein ligase UBR5 [Nymphon striatum]|nr:E3 ubiquitin-protein ligase UBR5 [Nymphon striatum]
MFYRPNKSNIFIIGDLNCRIGQDLNLYPALTRRTSRDLSISKTGQQLIQFIRENNLVVINGRTRSDVHGDFTFSNSNGSSVVDLAITNEANFSMVDDLQVSPIIGSDHFPISLSLNLPQSLLPESRPPISPQSLKTNYKALSAFLNSETGQTYIDNISNSLESMEGSIRGFYDLLEDHLVVTRNSKAYSPLIDKPDWFDRDCLNMSKMLQELARQIKRSNEKSARCTLLADFKSLKNSFENLKTVKKEHYVQLCVDRLSKLHPGNAKFWLHEASDRIYRYGTQTLPQLSLAKESVVKQCVIGPNHFAFLFEDGRVCRYAFSVFPERLDLSKNEPPKSVPKSGTSAQSGSRTQSRSRGRIISTNRRGGRTVPTSSSSSVIMGSHRTFAPPPYVPEELISQAQVVLQGKSRNLIIRELQRTNLDVNLAVNNLLSRDDEESEDVDDGQESYVPGADDLISLLDAGISGTAGSDHPSVIIDADTMFSEDMFGYSTLRNRASGRSRADRDRDPDRERDTVFRMRERQYANSRRWLETALRETGGLGTSAGTPSTDKLDDLSLGATGPDNKKRDSGKDYLWISDHPEFWIPDQNSADRKFIQIAGLHSELIALSNSGQLFQWKWSESEPFKNSENPNIHHPKVQSLGLSNEKVTLLSACGIVRASVVTEFNKVATWVDESISPFATHKLEHPAQFFSEFQADKIVSLHVCSLYTCVKLESDSIYWWGVMPFSQRKKVWEKYQAKAKKHHYGSRSSGTSNSEITVGSQTARCSAQQVAAILDSDDEETLGFDEDYPSDELKTDSDDNVHNDNDSESDSDNENPVDRLPVCMRSAPMCRAGAIGINISSGVPKVGQLMLSAWNFSESYRFFIIPTGNKKQESKLEPQHKQVENKIEMPPPPSPASSTCSDTGSISSPAGSHKRSKRPFSAISKDDSDKRDEEEWPLKDVIFVEDVKCNPIGQVLKIDGSMILVKFYQPKDSNNLGNIGSQGSEDISSLLQESRLLRKDDVQVIKPGTSGPRLPDCFQKQPKKVNIPDAGQLLTISTDDQGIHAIVRSSNKLSYSIYNVSTGKPDHDSNFPTETKAFLGRDPKNITLSSLGEHTITVVRDGNGTIYPFSKDCTDSIKEPQWLDLPTTQCPVALGLHSLQNVNQVIHKTKVALVVLVFQKQTLMSALMQCNVDAVTNILNSLKPVSESGSSSSSSNLLQQVLSEYTDGNRNILHASVSMCYPTSNKDSDQVNSTPGIDSIDSFANAIGGSSTTGGSNRSCSIREMMRRASTNAQESRLNRSSSVSLDRESSLDRDLNEVPLPAVPWSTEPDQNQDSQERKDNAWKNLKKICESPVFAPFMKDLLTERDGHGSTPFMLAISGRAYPAAMIILDTSQSIAKHATGSNNEAYKTLLMSMLYPQGGGADNSPLHVLCCNDTCSFTWTGAEHINQDIFECRTCGLTGSLCCCTECARVCHKGHDCKLKRTSPTAYCDCWEKCKCKALISGHQDARSQLLNRLISDTDFVTLPNSRGENILLFLVQTVGRQQIEQRQYRSSRVRNAAPSRKVPASDVDVEMPEHDLEPPRFSRRALEILMRDWNAVKSMLMSGYNPSSERQAFSSGYNANFLEDQMYLNFQSGTAHLDKFTHCLLVKCSMEMLDFLLSTIIKELQNVTVPGRKQSAKIVAQRFVRSVARIFVVLNIEMTPNCSRKKSVNNASQPIVKCKKVFQSLIHVAIEELCEIADSLIAPVRLGVARPTAPWALVNNTVDAVHGSEELFAANPLLSSRSATSTSNQNVNSNSSQPEPLPTPPVSRPSDFMEASPRLSRSRRSQILVPNNSSNQSNSSSSNRVEDVSMPQEEAEAENEREQENVPPEHDDEGVNESDMELDLLAESESDTDSNHSHQDNAGSNRNAAATGNSAAEEGVSNLIFFSEDDSAESSNQDEEEDEEEDESEAAETDEPDTEDLALIDEQLERRGANSSSITSAGSHLPSSSRSNLTPQTMQWAVRQRADNLMMASNLNSTSGARSGTTSAQTTSGQCL